MKLKQHFKEYLTFTKSERNGIIVLLLIIIGLISVHYFINKQTPDAFSQKNEEVKEKIQQFEAALYKKKKTIQQRTSKPITKDTLFHFDPNQASSVQLKKLGFTSNQINALKGYLKAGGKLYKKEDLKKIYGISQQQFNKLSPYIKIEEQEKESTFNSPKKKQSIKVTRKIKIDINTAGPKALQKLHGIGPVFAERIIKYRKLLGGFYNTRQLLEVYDFKQETYNNIQDMMYADTTKIAQINLNNADYKTLLRHPYLNSYQVKGLIRYRKLKKNIQTLDEIKKNNLLPNDVYIKMKPYFIVKNYEERK